jgi:outer membrane protein OmpA-like peptidoglycan-associated protein
MGSLVFEGGVRGEFNNFKVRLNADGNPMEWSAGAGFWLSDALSLHGAAGTGIGRGPGAPLMRLVAGVRYMRVPAPPVVIDDKVETMVTSEAFSDVELDRIMEQAQAEPPPPRLGEEETLLRLKVEEDIIDLGTVNFEFNSAKLTAKAKETVYKLHEILNQLKPKSVKIDGHTDSVGSYNYNLGLSKRRAESVRAELIRLGNPGSMITTEGFAFKFPVASNATPGGRAQNRRIEVSLDGKAFRKITNSKEEVEQFRQWIYPDGKQPKSNTGK